MEGNLQICKYCTLNCYKNDLLLRLERYNLGFCYSVLVVSTKGIIVNRRSINGKIVGRFYFNRVNRVNSSGDNQNRWPKLC